MKIGLLSDAHGNYLWFRKCLDELLRLNLDKVFFLGDAYGYFPEGNRVIDDLIEIGAVCLLGNHEAMLLGKLPLRKEKNEIYRLDASDLDSRRTSFINSLDSSFRLEIDGTKLLLVHGSPQDSLTDYCYPNRDLEDFLPTVYDCVFMGHTHRPFIKKKANTLFVNVGSCGMPRDIGNMPSYCYFDTKTRECQINRIAFSIKEILETYSEIHGNVKACMERRANEYKS